MIVVTGAAGALGSLVVENLLRLIPPSQVVASVRRPDRAEALTARGVEVRHGDYDDPESMRRSLAGADRVLLVSASGIDHEKRAARHRNVIDAARAGAGHVFYTSLLPGADSVAYVMKAHLDTERYLEASGLPFTVLKNGVYAEAWPQYLGEGGEAAVPADGPVSWVSRADLAEGTARLLLAGGHQGEALRLTGPAAVSLGEVAELLRRPLRIVPVDEYVARLRAAGKPEDYARRWATTYLGVARGEFGKVDPFLGALLGRPLRTVGEVVSGRLS